MDLLSNLLHAMCIVFGKRCIEKIKETKKEVLKTHETGRGKDVTISTFVQGYGDGMSWWWYNDNDLEVITDWVKILNPSYCSVDVYATPYSLY